MRRILAGLVPVFLGPAYANHLEADANGYIAQYERHLDIPVPTGAVDCSGDSAVNPNAADELIIRPSTVATSWDDVNNATYDLIFVCPGDYTSIGRIDLTADGTSGNPRYIVWWTDSGYDADLHPVDMLTAQKAIINEVDVIDVDWLIVDRLVVVPTLYHGFLMHFSQNSSNIIYNRIVIEGDDMDGSKHGFAIQAGNAFITVQNSVVRNCGKNNFDIISTDLYATQITQSDYTRVVNNEFYNCSSHVQINDSCPECTTDGPVLGIKIENNDIYVNEDIYTDCNGNFTSTAEEQCMCAEAGFQSKGGSVFPPTFGTVSAADLLEVIHNRLFGFRAQEYSGVIEPEAGCGASGVRSGNAVALVYHTNNLLFEHNIIHDSEFGLNITENSDDNELQYNEVRTNIFFDIEEHGDSGGVETISRALSVVAGSNHSLNFNTFVDTDTWWRTSGIDAELACNLVIDGGSVVGNDATHESHNVYAGNSADLNEPGQEIYTLAEANLDQFCFWERLITGPEEVCIANAKPTASSPFLDSCEPYSELPSYGVD